MPLQPGDSVLSLTLPAHDRRLIALGDEWARGPLVILFFPLAFTSTCTAELCSVAEDLASYESLEARVLAISVDSPYVLERYRQSCGATYDFLSDFNRQASRAFGVMRTSPIGPGLVGMSDRAAFVLDREGIVRYSWHSPDASLLPPFDEIKAALRSLRERGGRS